MKINLSSMARLFMFNLIRGFSFSFHLQFSYAFVIVILRYSCDVVYKAGGCGDKMPINESRSNFSQFPFIVLHFTISTKLKDCGTPEFNCSGGSGSLDAIV